MVKRAKMIFRINPDGISKDPQYPCYPAYFVEIFEENTEKGTYDYIGEWYFEEGNFLNILLEIMLHEKNIDGFRQREAQLPKLIQSIRKRKIHEFM